MCGIAAIFAYDNSAPPVQEGELRAIRDCMAVRGPDGSGEWYDASRRVALGHRRLAIIDMSAGGNQPMLLPERNLAIVFNGEIYNYRELRAELEGKGHQFRSASDTEVLLRLYAEHGEAMFEKLRGMYAFVIWDGAQKKLFLARDPFGIKPLYVADDGKTIRIASQLKALVAGGKVDMSPEPAGHVGFFLWGHVPAPYTLHRGVRNFVAGHCMTIDASGKKSTRAFCRIPDVLSQAERESQNGGAQSIQEKLRESLGDSIRHHLIADVPVGIFLSSGMDSTTIAALAAEQGGSLRTITLGFEEYKGTENDETRLAEEMARQLHSQHETVWVTRKDFEEEIHRLLAAMDQPSSDGVNSYFISKAAAQVGLKVALSGLGGDELFGSYPSFSQIPPLVSALHSIPLGASVGRGFRRVSSTVLKKFTSPKYAGLLEYGGNYSGAYLLRRGMFMPWELPDILDPDLVKQGWSELQTIARLDETTANLHSPYLKISALEMTWYMRHQLLRDTDWASMGHSLEIRVPFVDLELLRNLGPMLVGENRPTKRDMAQTPKMQLPASILNRPKTGFTVPVRDWLLSAFDPKPGAERGLRGWAREVYSMFADGLEMHRASLRRHKKSSPPSRSVSKKLRILILLTDGFGGFGGIAKFNRDFLTALCADKNVAEVIALPRLMPESPGPLPARLVYDTSGLGGKLRYLKAVRNLIKPKQSNGDQSQSDFDLIICAHLHLLPAAAWLRSRMRESCALHLVVHGIDAWEPTGSRLSNACVRRINGFISVSNVTKRRFMRWSRLRDDQGIVLPNCVDLSAFAPGPKSEVLLERYGLRGRKILMTLGRLASEERYKGFDEVLEVLPELAKVIPNVAYLICGDGADRRRLLAKARSLGLPVSEPGQKATDAKGPVVVFAGRISDKEKADHFRLADVYVMPSSGEGFGIVYLEALACGIPVIGSKADGSREALLNGKLGTLVDPRDRDELISAIVRVMSGSREKASAGLNGESVEYFSTARFQQRVHDILECITN